MFPTRTRSNYLFANVFQLGTFTYARLKRQERRLTGLFPFFGNELLKTRSSFSEAVTLQSRGCERSEKLLTIFLALHQSTSNISERQRQKGPVRDELHCRSLGFALEAQSNRAGLLVR